MEDSRAGKKGLGTSTSQLHPERNRIHRLNVARRDVSVQSGPQKGGPEMETEIEAPQSSSQRSRAHSSGRKELLAGRRNDAAFWVLGLLNNSGEALEDLYNMVSADRTGLVASDLKL